MSPVLGVEGCSANPLAALGGWGTVLGIMRNQKPSSLWDGTMLWSVCVGGEGAGAIGGTGEMALGG